jgi:phage major head subunit gpT-like protein
MTIVVASYAQASWPGIRDWFGAAYNRYPTQWTEIFDQYTSEQNFERDVLHAGLGLFRVKPELAPISYDDMSQVRKIDYNHVTYALGFVMSRESMEDNQYPQLSEQRAKELGAKAALTQEILAATWMSRVFSGSYLQSDGKAVIATDHPLKRGGTGSNKPAANVDFSEAALENAIIDIQQMPDDTNNRIAIRPMKLIVPPQLQFDVKRVLGNQDRPGTAERDINALVHIGYLPEGYCVNNYLEDSDAWFIKTDCPNGLKHYSRRAIEFTNDTSEFDTENARFKCTFRDSRGISNWRALWGSPGA